MQKLAAIALILLAAPVFAEKGPSAVTTAYYINDLLDPRLPTYPEGTFMHYTLVIGKDPCNPVLEGYTDLIRMRTPLPMRKLALNNVEVYEQPAFPTAASPEYAINLHSRDNERIFVTNTIIKGVGTPNEGPEFVLHVKGGSKYSAEKMAKAIRHLAKLCGAKDDIF